MQPDERNAMRAYLQRSEVRLSTLHRIATAFIGGSGLLILFPVFFKDVITSIINIWLDHWQNQFEFLGSGFGWLATMVLFLTIGIPFIMALGFPLYGVYLMLKDTVHFYYTLYAPGFSEDALTPSFALTGLLFPHDEVPIAKQVAMRYQYDETESQDYTMPFSKPRRRLYFDTIVANTNGAILPKSRPSTLHADLKLKVDPETFQHFNAALGVTRSVERSLAEEVAAAEMALVRHVMYLRRLVLRYVKTLLMFIWTTMISFLMLPFLAHSDRYLFVLLAFGYGVWSLAVLRIMRLPLGWIYRHRDRHIHEEHVDPQLTLMEDDLRNKCRIAQVSSIIGLVLAGISILG